MASRATTGPERRSGLRPERRPGFGPERRTGHGREHDHRSARAHTRGLAGGWALTAVAAAAALVLTACGSDGSGSDPASDTPSMPADTATGDGGAAQVDQAGTQIVPAAAMTGDCFANLPAVDHSAVQQVELTDCTEPHAVEIVDDFMIDQPQAELQHVEPIAAEECNTRARDAVDLRKVDPQMTVFYWAPAPEAWEQGDRGVICGVGLTDGMSSGSVRKQGS